MMKIRSIEYFADGKLPIDFENFKAAKNFGRWFLPMAKCVQ